MQRGRDFLQSRILCDEEWQSDVDAGRTIAEATLRHIYQKPDFRAELSQARKETAAALQSKMVPASCREERIALAGR